MTRIVIDMEEALKMEINRKVNGHKNEQAPRIANKTHSSK